MIHLLQVFCGFTPAYAGNTAKLPPPAHLQQVHPRIRGEYLFVFALPLPLTGSPPHTRGIQGYVHDQSSKPRFTPAYAGNTRLNVLSRAGSQVHPRIRGEYEIYRELRMYKEGSPPHTRGIRELRYYSLSNHRFTPAYAGNTFALSIFACIAQVHPRIRGEY